MVVERLEFHLDAFCSPVYPPWQLEEDLQAMPTRMSVRFWKIAVTRPCRFQRKREREMSLNPQDQAILSAKYFNVSAEKVPIFRVSAK